MNISRAGRRTRAFWRLENKMRRKWESEKPVTDAERAYGQYLRTCERLQGFAAGWVAGIEWARREMKSSKKKKT